MPPVQFPDAFQLPLAFPVHVNPLGVPIVIVSVGMVCDSSGSMRMLVDPFPGRGPVVPSFLGPMIGGFGPARLFVPAEGPETAVTSSVPLDKA